MLFWPPAPSIFACYDFNTVMSTTHVANKHGLSQNECMCGLKETLKRDREVACVSRGSGYVWGLLSYSLCVMLPM